MTKNALGLACLQTLGRGILGGILLFHIFALRALLGGGEKPPWAPSLPVFPPHWLPDQVKSEATKWDPVDAPAGPRD